MNQPIVSEILLIILFVLPVIIGAVVMCSDPTASAGARLALGFSALFSVGTADAGNTLHFLSYEEEHNSSGDDDQNCNNDKINHNYFFKAYSAFIFLLVLWMIARMIAAMTRIATRPAIAAVTLSVPPVTMVPMV